MSFDSRGGGELIGAPRHRLEPNPELGSRALDAHLGRRQSDTQLLGKVSEAEVIRRQMQRDLARQILTRIEVGMRKR